MMNRIDALERQKITLPIPQTLRQTAAQFAAEQSTSAKQRQVFNNTLAVGSTNTYLDLMEFSTDLAASDCWNPLLRNYANVADLLVVGIGHLECRPLSATQTCQLPLDLADHRVGLVLVELAANHRQATVWGFTPNLVPGAIVCLSDLQPLETLLHYLDVQERQAAVIPVAQWFAGQFAQGWQSVETLLGEQQWTLALSFRAAPSSESRARVTGAKLLDLGLELGTQPVVLLMAVTAEVDETLKFRVQLRPCADVQNLPAQMTLTLCTEGGDVVHAVTTRATDNFIQLPVFKCQPAEIFSLRIAYAGITVVERFDCRTLFVDGLSDHADG